MARKRRSLSEEELEWEEEGGLEILRGNKL